MAMDSPSSQHPTRTEPATAAEGLDAFGDCPEGDDRCFEEQFDRLIITFEPDDLVSAVRDRLDDLGGRRGEAVLRLVESLGDLDLLDALAEALVDQPDLAPERTWEALALLEGTGQIESRPELTERRLDLLELLEEDDQASLQGLIDQLEDDPEEVWVALQGLSAIEPEVRAEIVSGLGRGPLGPGLAEFLRLLAYSDDPAVRSAALDALAAGSAEESTTTRDPHRAAAWADLAAHHPDPEVNHLAKAERVRSGQVAMFEHVNGGLPAARRSPRLLDGLVTALDGEGRGQVALVVEDRGERVTAAFLCDVLLGVREVIGQVDRSDGPLGDLRSEILAQPDLDVIEEAPELAVGLLAGALSLRGPEAPATLRHWVERTLGPSFRAQPFSGLAIGANWDPARLPFEEMPERSRAVLNACPAWVDRSALTVQIAEELLLREPGSSPDPRQDAGAYRYLFEHRIHDRLELYRRMLSWMGWFWQAAGDVELSRSALGLAWQLSDPQHVVPAHPFTIELTTRSLIKAQEAIRWGRDHCRPARLTED
ncbi:hypothetical protein BH23PLA1_BH23PLA1_33290 [soil metagenome]